MGIPKINQKRNPPPHNTQKTSPSSHTADIHNTPHPLSFQSLIESFQFH